jgi:signal transduction histidine kinase/CheY-like chemotaxis protein
VTGLSPEHPAAADGVGPGFEHSFWPLATALADAAGTVITLPRHVEWPRGTWDHEPLQAVLLPLPSRGAAPPAGVLVAGLNRFRPFDASYRNFIALFANQVSAALEGAHLFEEERERAAALAELDRAKTAFFSNVSHEFRTPLTLMLAPTEDALTRGGVLAGKELETVYDNELRLLRLVNTLLDFSRIQAGRISAAYRLVDLARLTTDLASTFRSAVERAGLEFRVDCRPPRAPVFVDPQMWERILLNLLSNAFKFTFTGSIAVGLTQQSGGRVELTVSDTGIGIASHELPRVFERFHRIEGTRARTHEGSGIGLALVSDLVKLHGGVISVESQPDQGTTFRVSIPTGSSHLPAERIVDRAGELAPGPAERSLARQFVNEAARWLPLEDAAEPAPLSRTVRPGRLLVADDNADMREYLTRILRAHWHVDDNEDAAVMLQHALGSLGYQVEVALDGPSALDACKTFSPDVALLDIGLPVMDGYELAQRLRELLVGSGRVPSLRLLAVTGYGQETDRARSVAAGFDEHLVKPIDLARLARSIEGAPAKG